MNDISASIKECSRLAAEGKVDELLRYSGEALARAGNEFAAATDRQSRTATGEALLVLTVWHTEALKAAGMVSEAFATSVMAALTFLRGQASPTAVPTYAGVLQMAFVQAYTLLGESMGRDAYAEDHYKAMTRMLAPLSQATDELFIGREDCPPMLRQWHDLIAADIADVPELFTIKEVRPEMAIDILSDCAARLAAMGALDN